MRTEQDLRAALATREDLAPGPDPVLDGARRVAVRHRRRRTAGTVAAVAIVVAAVLAVPAVLANRPSPEPVPQPPAQPPTAAPAPEPFGPADPRPPFAFTIQPGTVAGFEIHPVAVTADYQIAWIWQPGEAEPVAELAVYAPGVDSTVSDEVVLRWKYASDAFAEIYGDSDSAPDEQTAQRIADGLELTAPYEPKLPYRLDHLPAGVALVEVTQDTAHPGAFRSIVSLIRRDNSDPLVLDITIADDPTERDDPSWDWQPTTVAGRQAECAELVDGRRCRVELDELTVSIGTNGRDPATGLDLEELARLVDGLQPATWQDPTSWYGVGEALPIE